VDVPALMDTIPLIATANRLYIGMEPGALAEWAVADLVRAGAAAIENDLLIDR
jgi:hypothetical protein